MAQLGTIRLQTGSGTVSVPVFALGDSGSNVYEFLRVQTAGGTGFIPVTSTSNATYPYLRLHSQSYGTLAVHDSASISWSYYLKDDWGDNLLNSRSNDKNGGTYVDDEGDTLTDARYRPEWTAVPDGITISASNGKMHIKGSTTNNNFPKVYTGSSLDVGKATFDISLGGMTTDSYHANNLSLHWIWQDSSNWVRTQVSIKTGLSLQKNNAGTKTDMISNSSAVRGTTSVHTIDSILDTAEDVELILDGTSQGTATNAFVPAANRMHFAGFEDASGISTEFHIDNLLYR